MISPLRCPHCQNSNLTLIEVGNGPAIRTPRGNFRHCVCMVCAKSFLIEEDIYDRIPDDRKDSQGTKD